MFSKASTISLSTHVSSVVSDLVPGLIAAPCAAQATAYLYSVLPWQSRSSACAGLVLDLGPLPNNILTYDVDEGASQSSILIYVQLRSDIR